MSTEKSEYINVLDCVEVKYNNLEGGFYHIDNFIPIPNEKWSDKLGFKVNISYKMSDNISIYQWGKLINVLEWEFCSDFDIDTFKFNEGKWIISNIKSYNFDFYWTCYCDENNIYPVNITVENEVITKIINLDSNKELLKNEYSRYKTMDNLFNYINENYDDSTYNIDVLYNNKLGYLSRGYIDESNKIADEKIGFNVNNLKFRNNFILNKVNIYKIIDSSHIDVKVTVITKDLPPSKIVLNYGYCDIRYILNNNAEVGYYYEGNIYEPENLEMLRYTEDNILTQDYKSCRVTIFNDLITIEKPDNKISDDSLTIEKSGYKILDKSIKTIVINENQKIRLNIMSGNKLVVKLKK